MSKEENTPYSFKGDNAKLVSSIKSLLALDSKGALVPNGIGGLARQLLESAVERLGVDAQPVAWIKPDVLATLRGDECCYAFGEQSPKGNLVPLFTRSDAGEIDRLEKSLTQALSRHADTGVELALLNDKLAKASAYVQKMVDCAGTQPSVATGYLRDILDVLNGSAEPANQESAQ